jgi:hypothetical protein
MEGVSLEPDPAPTLLADGGLAAGGGDPTFTFGRRLPGAGMEVSSQIGEMIREKLVEAMARKAEGGTGKGFVPKPAAPAENRESGGATRSGLGQDFFRKQRTQKVMAATAEVLPADAVARVGTGFVELDGHLQPAEAQPEGESGQAAANDVDGFHPNLRAEKKWVKGPADCSRSVHPEAGQRAESSWREKPASTLTRAS